MTKPSKDAASALDAGALDPIPAEQVDPTATQPVERPKAPAPSAPQAEPGRKTWLTAVSTDSHGPAGRFLDLTAEEAAAAPDGILIAPTEEQLALRVR